MRLVETTLPGAYVVETDAHSDERGTFVRTFDAGLFARHDLDAHVAQRSTSGNRRRGTLRGLHFQRAPHAEAKLVGCRRGSMYDVIVDLRPGSPTEHRWFAIELDAVAGRLLYVPAGFAHGFQTLEDDTEVDYQMSHPYVAEAAGGVRWDDPALGIEWPAVKERVISERDRCWPHLS